MEALPFLTVGTLPLVAVGVLLWTGPLWRTRPGPWGYW
jgi:hypothetical protein